MTTPASNTPANALDALLGNPILSGMIAAAPPLATAATAARAERARLVAAAAAAAAAPASGASVPAAVLDGAAPILRAPFDGKVPAAVTDYSAPADFLTTLRVCAETNTPTMLIGPAGTGKTEAVQCVAAALGRPMVKIDCGAVRDASDWFGTPTSVGGRIGWQDSVLAAALQTEGCIILLDEINRSHSAAQNGLLGALDGTRRVSFPSRAEPVVVADNVSVFASANIGLAFSSTGAIDLALMDRFTAVETDYLAPSAESSLIRERIGTDFKATDAEALAEIAAHTRTRDWGNMGGRAISTRRLLTVARLWHQFNKRGASPALAVRTLVTAQPDEAYGSSTTPRRALAAHIARNHSHLA